MCTPEDRLLHAGLSVHFYGTGTIDPANPSPHGKVPEIYLPDKVPRNRLGPLVGERDCVTYLSGL